MFGRAPVSIDIEVGLGLLGYLDPVDPGMPYVQRQTWIGFRVTAQYPYADVYPLFVRSDLSRADGQALGEGMSPVPFDGQPAIQVSRCRPSKEDSRTRPQLCSSDRRAKHCRRRR